MAAHHWRVVRTKLALAGILDPMQMSSLHSMLDIVEAMVLESMSMGENPDMDKMKRTQFLDSIYRPDPIELVGAADIPQAIPAGFGDEDVEAAWDAFAAAAAG